MSSKKEVRILLVGDRKFYFSFCISIYNARVWRYGPLSLDSLSRGKGTVPLDSESRDKAPYL